MIDEINVTGYKRFRTHGGFTLTSLNKVNVLVGPNGSGKSSFLEILTLLLPKMGANSDISAPLSSEIRDNFYSLFEGGVSLKLRVSAKTYNVGIDFDNSDPYIWKIRSDTNGQPIGIAVKYLGNSFEGINMESFQANLEIRQFNKTEDYLELNNATSVFDDNGSSIGLIRQQGTQYGPISNQDGLSIKEKFFSNGVHCAANIDSALYFGENRSDLRLTILDEVEHSLYPKMRKIIFNKIVSRVQTSDAASQVFFATHNIEVVSEAIKNQDCNVYFFSKDGMPMIANDGEMVESQISSGISSPDASLLISKMLGLEGSDFGLPEVPLLVEEESKKFFLEAYFNRSDVAKSYKAVDILVGSGGDSQVQYDIGALIQMSKFFAYSNIWESVYVIFIDWNSTYFDITGKAKTSDNNGGNNNTQKIYRSQDLLKERFILTKHEGTYVPSLEQMYPKSLIDEFRKDNSIDGTIEEWLKLKNGKGKTQLAAYIGERISMDDFAIYFAELDKILKK